MTKLSYSLDMNIHIYTHKLSRHQILVFDLDSSKVMEILFQGGQQGYQYDSIIEFLVFPLSKLIHSAKKTGSLAGQSQGEAEFGEIQLSQSATTSGGWWSSHDPSTRGRGPIHSQVLLWSCHQRTSLILIVTPALGHSILNTIAVFSK